MAVIPQSSIGNRSFSYRVPRYKTDAPIDLIVGDHVTLGACKEVSEAGMLALFALPVPANADGTITLYSGEDRIQLPVHIDSVRGEEVVLRLQGSTEEELKTWKNFIKLLVDHGSIPLA